MQVQSEDVAFLVWSLGCSWNIPISVALSISLLGLVLSFRSSSQGRRSIRCVCSNVAFHCGVVSSTTGLTGWVDRSRSSVSPFVCIVRFVIAWNFIVGVGVCLGATIVVVVISGTIRVILDLVFFSFELTTLSLIVTWFFAMVASCFGLFRVLLWCLLRHSVYLHFIWSFQTN